MITREQVADLRPGDVVCVTNDKFPDVIMQGPLRADPETSGRRLMLGATVIRCDDRSPLYPAWTLTVLSRAPRQLYVNHDRTEPVNGDSARDADSDADDMVFIRIGGRWWDKTDKQAATLPKHLRLLVDGETGQVVP